jgi:hypothetical protein
MQLKGLQEISFFGLDSLHRPWILMVEPIFNGLIKKKVALIPKKADKETGDILVLRGPIVNRRWLSSCRKPCGHHQLGAHEITRLKRMRDPRLFGNRRHP